MKIKGNFVALCALGVAVISATAPVRAESKGQVVIANYGGAFADVIRETVAKPFERETGIKVVIDASGPTLAKIRTMVNAASTQWDLVDLTEDELDQLARERMLERIDYSGMDQSILADFPKESVLPYGMGGLRYAKVLAYNTKNFPQGNRPKNWADFWDVKKYPGQRAVTAGRVGVAPVEFALLADGVEADKLYPLDFKRAYAAFSRIKPDVLKWTTTPAMEVESLISGEAVMSPAWQGRVQIAKEEGAPLDYSWNQAMTIDYYYSILKGSKNQKNALKFIEFASRPEIQAAIAKRYVAGPLNKKAFDLIPVERAKLLPTYPENAAKSFRRNSVWWGRADAAGKTNQERNQEMWNRWAMQ